jgi:hypothetical protein
MERYYFGENMHAFNVVQLFQIGGRGIVVATDKTLETFPQNLQLRIGDEIEFRQNGVILLTTRVAGVEHCDPWSPKHPFAFLLPPDIMKQDIPIGAEIWTSSDTQMN